MKKTKQIYTNAKDIKQTNSIKSWGYSEGYSKDLMNILLLIPKQISNETLNPCNISIVFSLLLFIHFFIHAFISWRLTQSTMHLHSNSISISSIFSLKFRPWVANTRMEFYLHFHRKTIAFRLVFIYTWIRCRSGEGWGMRRSSEKQRRWMLYYPEISD